jgi:signal transduction histidine kinase
VVIGCGPGEGAQKNYGKATGDMNILTKGLLLISVPVVFQLVFVGVLIRGQTEATEAEGWASHSDEVIAQVEQVQEPVLAELSEMRRAVVTGEKTAGGDAAYWTDLEGRADRLKTAVSDKDEQEARAISLRKDVEAFHGWVSEVTAAIDKGDRAAAEARVKDNSGKDIVDRMTSTADAFLKTERGLSADRRVTAADARLRQRWVLFGAAGAAVLAGGAAAILFARGVGARLAVVTANARRLADGSPLAAPVTGSDEIAALDAVLHDTGNRLAGAEATQSRFKAELQQRADELGVVNENLRQQTQENEMFIYSVSHDLRSPLVNLQGFGKELRHACDDLGETVAASALPEAEKKRIGEILKSDIGESLRYLQTAVMRASNIIDALLRLSRAGRVEYSKVKVDVATVVGRVVDAMQGTIKERGAEVVVKGLKPVAGDATAVEQVFGNLVGNAVNYLDAKRAGRIEVGMVESGSQKSEVGSQKAEGGMGMHVYYVKDNGMGIPKAYMGKMFTAFQRLHGNAVKGEGIGLALVRRMAERHGGRVWVESEEGIGTTFFVSLPAWVEGGA